jgi:hypothetical protein
MMVVLMGVIMLMIMILDTGFTFTTAADGTHSMTPKDSEIKKNLFDFEFLDPHLITARDLQLMTTAFGTGIEAGLYRHRLATGQAPGLTRQFDDLQHSPISQAALHYRVETETHRLRVDPGEDPNLQPDPLHLAKALTLGTLLKDLQYTLTQRHLVHQAISKL